VEHHSEPPHTDRVHTAVSVAAIHDSRRGPVSFRRIAHEISDRKQAEHSRTPGSPIAAGAVAAPRPDGMTFLAVAAKG
jgi:hypothetical protein